METETEPEFKITGDIPNLQGQDKELFTKALTAAVKKRNRWKVDRYSYMVSALINIAAVWYFKNYKNDGDWINTIGAIIFIFLGIRAQFLYQNATFVFVKTRNEFYQEQDRIGEGEKPNEISKAENIQANKNK